MLRIRSSRLRNHLLMAFMPSSVPTQGLGVFFHPTPTGVVLPPLCMGLRAFFFGVLSQSPIVVTLVKSPWRLKHNSFPNLYIFNGQPRGIWKGETFHWPTLSFTFFFFFALLFHSPSFFLSDTVSMVIRE